MSFPFSSSFFRLRKLASVPSGSGNQRDNLIDQLVSLVDIPQDLHSQVFQRPSPPQPTPRFQSPLCRQRWRRCARFSSARDGNHRCRLRQDHQHGRGGGGSGGSLLGWTHSHAVPTAHKIPAHSKRLTANLDDLRKKLKRITTLDLRVKRHLNISAAC